MAAAALGLISLAFTPHTTLSKTTTWTNFSPSDDNWSNPGNWDNGVPATGDSVLFSSVGGMSTMDIPALALASMDMTGFSGVLDLNAALTVDGDLTTDGILDQSGDALAVGGSLTVSGGYLSADGTALQVSGTVHVVAPAALDMGSGLLELGGNLEVDPGAGTAWDPIGGILAFTGGGSQTWNDQSVDPHYGNVDVVPGGHAVIPASSSALTIDGNVSVGGAGGTVEVGVDIIVGGGATVATGAAVDVPAGPKHPLIEFRGLFDLLGTLNVANGGSRLRFAAGAPGTVTVGPAATFEVVGTPSSHVRLEQDGVAGGPQWIFDHDPTAAIILDYVDVQDSDASPGPTVSPNNSVDLGNNTNWIFLSKTTTWTPGGISDLWSETTNWDNGVPALGDYVLFDPVGGLSMVDIPSLSLGSMDMSGFSGTLALGESLDIAGFVTVSGTFELASHSLTVGGDLTVGGTLNASSSSLWVDGAVHVAPGGSLEMNDGTLDLKGDLTIDPGASSLWDPIGGTLRFTGTSQQVWTDQSGGATYGAIEIDGSSDVLYGSDSKDCILGYGGVDGVLSIQGEDVLFGGSGEDLLVWGHVNIVGEPNHPHVTFNGPVELGGAFNATGAATLRFTAGIAGAVTVGPAAVFAAVGVPGDPVRLEQDGIAGGSQWILSHDPTAALTFDHVEVQDCDASSGPPVIATNALDDGNNTNWIFPPKTTTWTPGGISDLWSEATNWDNGVPATGDTVLFDPVGGLSLMDIPLLTLESMDMTGYSGTLTLDTSLDIAGFVTVSGTFALSGHSLDVGGKLTVGGTLDVDAATLSTGDSLVVGGSLVVTSGLLDLYGPMACVNAELSLDSLSGMNMRYPVEFYGYGDTSKVDTEHGHLTSLLASSANMGAGFSVQWGDVTMNNASSDVKLTFSGGAVAVRNEFDGVQGELGLEVPSFTVGGNATFGFPAGPLVRVTGEGVTLDVAGQTLSGNFAFDAPYSTASFHDVTVTGAFTVDSVGTSLRFAPGHTVTVQTGATMQVVGGGGGGRSELRLDDTPLSDQWLLDVRPGATTNFENVKVQDSDASHGQTCVATGQSVDLGNNDNWTFPPKTTTWTHGGITDNWSELANWDNGFPATGDTVLFGPIGGPSLMDVPLLTLESMDMTGYSGTLTLGDSLDIAGFVTVSGTFALSGHSLDVGGELTVGGTLDAGSARVSVGDSLFVPGGTLVVHGGLLDLYGPMDGASATLDFDSLSVMRVRATVDLTDFSGGYDMGGLESRGEFDREFHSAEVSWGDVVIDHASSDVKMTFKGGPVAVRNQFDGREGDLHLEVDSLTILGDANLGLPAGPFLRVSGTGVKLDVLGQTLTGNFSFEADHSVATFDKVKVAASGVFLALSPGTDLRFGPGDSVIVESGATMQVVGGTGAVDRSKLRLDGTAGSDQWLLDVRSGATTNFENVDVQDSDASPGETCTATGDSHDLGNNENWNFPPKTTTWIHGGITDNWSELGNWDNGVPAIGDTVLFDPIGGASVMDVPSLSLESMDMTGYSGSLTLGDSLDISGFVTVSGTFALSGHSLDVAGELTIGGTLDAASARVSVGDSLFVPGGTLVMTGGLLDLYGPMDGTIGAELECDSFSTMRMRRSVDLEAFAHSSSSLVMRIESDGSEDRSFRSGTATFHSLGIDHSSSSAKLTLRGGPFAVRNEFDWVEGDLHLEVDSLTVLGDANLGLPAGPVVRLTGDGVTITLAGQTLSGNFSFEATHSVASFHDVDVTGAFLAVGDGAELRFGPGDSVTVESGATMEVVGGSITDRSKLCLDGTPLSDQWVLDVRTGATTHFENIEVQDSDASPGQTCVATGECIDLGNNDNWQFVASAAGDTPPTRLTLRAAPNPFNPSTTIHYGVPADGRVTIRIYDVRGALVRTVLSAVRKRGVYTEPWDGTDDARHSVGSGVYFCRIQAGGASETAKLVLLK